MTKSKDHKLTLSDFSFDNVAFDEGTHYVFADAYLEADKDLNEIFHLDRRAGEHVVEFSVTWDRHDDYVSLDAKILDADLCEMDRSVPLSKREATKLRKTLSNLFAEEYGEAIEEYDPNPEQDEDCEPCEWAHTGMCSECYEYQYGNCPFA